MLESIINRIDQADSILGRMKQSGSTDPLGICVSKKFFEQEKGISMTPNAAKIIIVYFSFLNIYIFSLKRHIKSKRIKLDVG